VLTRNLVDLATRIVLKIRLLRLLKSGAGLDCLFKAK
jgi:hypothetical protein